MRKTTIIITSALALAGCGSSSRELPADGGNDDVILPGSDLALGDAGTDTTADGPVSSCTPTSPPTGDGISRKVTFTFSVTGGGKAWLVTSGEWCSPFGINMGSKLRLVDPYNIECEGPAPPAAYYSGATPLSSSPTLTWDGMEVWSYTDCVDCSPAWPGMGIIDVTKYVKISSKPGTYTADFGVLESIPQNCTEDPTTGALICDGYGTISGDSYAGEACPMPPRVVTVSFNLPQAAGEITVPVEVTTTP